MMRELVLGLFDCGIVQFGLFRDAEHVLSPIKLDLMILPSYPQLLRQVSEACAEHVVSSDPDGRLCCALEMMPIVLQVGQILTLPIVYSPYRERHTAHEFIGAYDIGHRSLIMWSCSWVPVSHELTSDMGRVGLIHEQTLHLIGDEGSVFPLVDMLAMLVQSQRITQDQSDNTLVWWQAH